MKQLLLAAVTLASLLGVAPVSARAVTPADDVIWQQVTSGQSTVGPSQKSRGQGYNVDSELTDDFNLSGSVTKIYVDGYNGAITTNPPFYGLYVRFYAYNLDGTPGALQAEYYRAAGDPGLTYDPLLPSDFTMTLSPAFQATGQHFVAVQPVMDPVWQAYWYQWDADNNAPRGVSYYFRNPAGGQPNWVHQSNADLTFTLYGTSAPQTPVLTSLSAASQTRSGLLKLTGSGFGFTQGTGTVLVGGQPAPITRWSDTSITAYVPESAPLGTVDVQVVTAGGASGSLPLQVTLRQPDGRVQWRFQADDLYILQRPAVGPDGTIYAIGVPGHLYALSPDGGLKWIFQVGGAGEGQVSVGPDGTIYAGGGIGTVFAINPDGTQKWQFTDTTGGQGIIAGPNVGPDGNIYAVTDLGGRGAMALSPAGQLLWSRKPRPGFQEYGQLGEEVVFGSGQMYFAFDMYGTGFPDSLFGLKLNGSPRFRVSTGQQLGQGQAAVGPDGTVYTDAGLRLKAYTPAGQLKWSFFPDGTNVVIHPDVASDGTVYTVRNLSSLYAVNPNGTEKWHITDPNILNTVMVQPQNQMVVSGGQITYGQPGIVAAFSTTSQGQKLWQVNLPSENGGYIIPMARPRFSPDGSSVYIGMTGNNYAPEPYTYLYAISTAP